MKNFVSVGVAAVFALASVEGSVAQPSPPALTAVPPPPPAAPPVVTAPQVAPAPTAAPPPSTPGALTGGATQEPAAAPGVQPAPPASGATQAGLSAAVTPSTDGDVYLRDLRSHSGLNASTGILRTNYAGSGSTGTFRFGILASYYSGSGFLCPQCTSTDGGPGFLEDEVARVAGHLLISATPLDYLEVYLGIHSTATSNSRGEPELLQVLGDSTWGVKAFLPHEPSQVFSAGGALELLLLNGAGGVGIDAASVALRGLATANLNHLHNPRYRLPLIVNFNLSYVFDNSGSLIEEAEANRGSPISRIERYGLNINRVDRLVPALGVEGSFEFVRPFVEWSIDIPSNRQGHSCVVATLNPSDRCIDTDPSVRSAPARLTIGARGVLPMLEQLAFTAALDFATGGVSTPFWEEVQPETPWNLHFGVGYAVDLTPHTKRVPTPAKPTPNKALKQPAAPPPQYFVEGVVVEEGANTVVVPGAILRYEGRQLTGMVAGPAGNFRTTALAPGTYTLNVSAADYIDGVCRVRIDPKTVIRENSTRALNAAPAGASAPPSSTEAMGSSRVSTLSTIASSTAPDANGVVHVTCALKAKPRVGNVDGFLVDGVKGAAVPNAQVKITDAIGRSLELETDVQGAFRFENVPPGNVTLTVSARGYMPTSAAVSIIPRDDVRVEVPLFRRPRFASVVLKRDEIVLRKPITFAYGTAQLDTASRATVDELAALLVSRPKLGLVEVQGHMDNTSPADVSLELTTQRASVVRDMLIRAGVDAARIRARGYGDTVPLHPNDTPVHRALNERIQVVRTR